MMPRLRDSAIILTLFLLFTGLQLLTAQVTAGSIGGQIFDGAGRVIPNAQILLVNQRDGSVRKILANSLGHYSLIGLPPADYTLSVTAAGFSEFTKSGISLAVDTDLSLDFSLTVGGPKTRIEVSAEPSLQTETADLGAVIDEQFTETLPLNARDFLQLALLAPGAFPPVEGSQLSSNGGKALEVNGGREEYNNFLLDGADNNDPYISGYVVEPAVDSV